MLMDEPFSAVDPIVREQLQDEFLRLQGELGKTIVFVTHDIDEAIKLGDQVAVLRVGGHARPARRAGLPAGPPGRRLRRRLRRARPRLPRARASSPPRRCRSGRSRTVQLGATPEQVRPATADGWVLVAEDDRPLGWVEPCRIDRDLQHRADGAPRRHRRRASGPLRDALDAALSSPSRRGVIVDDDGRAAAAPCAPTRCSPPSSERSSARPTGPRGATAAGARPPS